MRADELIRHLISVELTNYRVVRTSPEPLQHSAHQKEDLELTNPGAFGRAVLEDGDDELQVVEEGDDNLQMVEDGDDMDDAVTCLTDADYMGEEEDVDDEE
jgi:hypothetical protein